MGKLHKPSPFQRMQAAWFWLSVSGTVVILLGFATGTTQHHMEISCHSAITGGTVEFSWGCGEPHFAAPADTPYILRTD